MAKDTSQPDAAGFAFKGKAETSLITVSFQVEPALLARIVAAKASTGVNRSSLIRQCVERVLSETGF